MAKKILSSLSAFLIAIAVTYATGINGPTTVCAGAQDVYYDVQTSGGGLQQGSYTWRINGLRIGRATGYTVNVDFPSSGISHLLEVTFTPDIGPVEYYSLSISAFNPGSLSINSSAICDGQSAILTLTDQNGGSFFWQRKINSGSWSTIATVGFPNPLNDSDHNPGNTYYYRAGLNTTGAGACGTIYSNQISVFINHLPAQPAANNVSRCGSGSVSLSATPGTNGNTIRWYTTGGTFLHQGNTYSPNISSTTTYRATSFNTTTGCLGYYKAVTATVNPIPAGVASVSPAARCGPGSVTLSASPGSNGNSIRWYAASSGGSPLHTGTSYSPSISASTTYYTSSYNTSTGCESTAARVAVVGTVNPVPGGVTSVTPGSRCGSGTVTLSASPGSNGNSIRWYTASSGGSPLHTGTSYSPSISSTTTYYTSSYNTSTGCQSAATRVSVTATIYTIPGSVASVTPDARCGSGQVTLSATPGSNANSIRWYAASSGGSPLHTGTSYSPSISSTTTYYTGSYNTSTGCQSTAARVPVTGTVHPFPAVVNSVDPDATCGPGQVNLGATPGTNANSIRWYAASSGGSPLHTGTSYSPSISSATTYYTSSYNTSTGCESIAARVPVTGTVDPVPGGVTSVTPGSQCGSGTVTLSATPGSNANSIRWYASSSGGAPLHTGTSYSPSISTTTTYHTSSYNTATGCESTVTRVPVTGTVNEIPAGVASVTPASVCGSGQAALSATPGSAANSIRWYASASGGSPLHTGTSFSPSISSTTTYYTSSYNTSTECESTAARVPVTATVLEAASVPATGESWFGRFGQGSITLSATGAGPDEHYQWLDAANNVLPGETESILTRHFEETTTYKVTLVHPNSCASAPLTITGNVIPSPVISTGGTTFLETGNDVVLSVPDVYSSYQWRKDGADIPGATGNSYTTGTGGQYTTKVELPNGRPGVSGPMEVTIMANAPDASLTIPVNNEPPVVTLAGRKNYVRTYSAREALQSETAFQIATFDPDEVAVSTTYFDGLGMPVQAVTHLASPSGKDVVIHQEYDAYGRTVKTFLPFTSSTSADADGYRRNAKNEQYHFYRDGTPHIPVTGIAYSEKAFEASPLNRVLKEATPGEEWNMGTGHEVKTNTWANTADRDGAIIFWTVNTAGKLVRSGIYATAELSVSQVMNEEDQETREYKDREGRIVLQKVKGDEEDWLLTYFVYDQFNDLRFVLPPELVKNLPANFDWDTHYTTAIEPWAYEYKYDSRKRPIHKKIPGAGWVFMIYDKLDRLVLSQDAEQRAEALWSFTKYDLYGRPALSGLYKEKTGEDEASLRSAVSAQAAPVTISGNDYTLTSGLPLINEGQGDKVLGKTYYDNHNLPAYFDSNYSFVSEIGTGSESDRISGKPTAALVRNLDDDTWLGSKTYYDNRGRAIQVISKNHRGGYDRISTRYFNITDKMEEVRTTHNVGVAQVQTGRRYDYDAGDRLIKVWHRTGSQDEVVLAAYEYNEAGQLVRKKLHSTNEGGSYLQATDQAYNIRGQLTRINDAALAGDFTDQFGMEFFYENGFDLKQRNGNISGVKWKNAHDGKQRAYGYVYDNLSRLRVADHSAKNISGAWTDESGRYNEMISQYDHNGNIMGLHRWGLSDPQAQTFSMIDLLDYDYQGNRLMRVTDTQGAEGFKNGTNLNDDYTYDTNGRLTQDLNKDVASIVYNHLNLVEKVTKSNGDYVKYIYNAGGVKLRQEVWRNSAATPEKVTDYMGEFIYENDTLKFIQTEEGRVLAPLISGSGLYEYQYQLKDHLGNVRMVLAGGSDQHQATMELAVRTEEEAAFLNLENASFISLSTYNHTSGGTYSIRLSGNTSEVIGPAKSFEVAAGDYFEMDVYAKYAETGGGSSGLGNLFNALAAAFSLPATGGSGLESQAAYNAFDALFGAGAYIGDDEPYEDENAPKAYLNYILFDNNFNLIDFGFDQINDGSTSSHDLLSLKLKITQPGYLYIFLSNENGTPRDVYFDDFTIKHTHIDVIQATDYYAFGMDIKGTAYNKANAFRNQFKYNGKEMQDELALGLYDYGARMYMADIGRWGVLDPMAEKYYSWTPYKYALNNPLTYIDPTGMFEINTGYQKIDSRGNTGAVTHFGLGDSFVKVDKKLYRNTNEFFKKNPEIDFLIDGDQGQGIIIPNVNSGKGMELFRNSLNRGFEALERAEAQQGEPGKPFWNPGGYPAWKIIRDGKDISDPTNYPGIKIYETPLIARNTAVTLPGIGILIHPSIKGLDRKQTLQHEYGHFLDYKFSPDLNFSTPGVPSIPIINFYLFIGIPSAFDLIRGSNYQEHHTFYTEQRADKWAEIWFGKNYAGK